MKTLLKGSYNSFSTIAFNGGCIRLNAIIFNAKAIVLVIVA